MRYVALAHCVTGDPRVLRRPGDVFDAEPDDVAALVALGVLQADDGTPDDAPETEPDLDAPSTNAPAGDGAPDPDPIGP